MWDYLREDLQRYADNPRDQIRALVFYPRLWAIAEYRFARWVGQARWPRFAKRLMNIVVSLLDTLIAATTSIELPANASIGPGLFIPHTGYIVVGSGVTIGHHCTLTQGVTLGHAGGGHASLHDFPVIGDRVYIGPGGVVIGAISIGHDALIGAGAVVTRSVPPRGVAVGNPARVISLKGSFDLITYPNMENDSERLSALKELEITMDDPEPLISSGAK